MADACRALAESEVETLYRDGLKHASPFAQTTGKPGFERWRDTDNPTEAAAKKH